MYSNSRDQKSLEESYKQVHNEELVEENAMDLVNQAIHMVGQAWQEFDHAKTYAQLSPQDTQVVGKTILFAGETTSTTLGIIFPLLIEITIYLCPLYFILFILYYSLYSLREYAAPPSWC